MRLLIVILVLLILGLYFFTESTKGIIKVTGKATVTATKEAVNDIRDSKEFDQLKQNIQNKTKEQFQKIKNDLNEENKTGRQQ